MATGPEDRSRRVRHWLRRLSAGRRKSGRGGIQVNHLSDEQMAERESRWKVEAAAAREEAFRDGGVLRLSEVSALELPESLVHLGIAFDDRLIVVSTAADPEHTFAGRDETPGFASFPHSAASETYSIDVQLIQTHGPMEVRRVDRVPVCAPFRPGDTRGRATHRWRPSSVGRWRRRAQCLDSRR